MLIRMRAPLSQESGARFLYKHYKQSAVCEYARS